MSGAADIDGPVVGVAVTRATARGGAWLYRDGGAWTPFPAVSLGRALLLRSDAEIRFEPAVGATVASGSFDYKAWDGTTGGVTGDRRPATTTAFSRATETATFSLGNAAPSFAAGPAPTVAAAVAQRAAGLPVSMLLGRMTDPDRGALKGLAVTAATGDWEYSLDGGRTWNKVGDVSSGRLLLRANDRLRTAGPVTAAELTFVAWDRTAGVAGDRLAGPSDALSPDGLTLSILV
jgi:hypothetical protein